MSLKRKILNKAKQLDIQMIGFCEANQLIDIEKRIKYANENGLNSEMDKKDIQNQICPANHLENVKSIITIGQPYTLRSYSEASGRGIISSMAIGVDYHSIIRNKLEKLQSFIAEYIPDHKFKICVDTCDLNDRHMAYRSGFGLYGKNGFLINPSYGSGYTIGYLMLDYSIDITNQTNTLQQLEFCNTCRRCIKACPNNAIINDNYINYNKCISYLTQTKRYLTFQEREIIGKRIYGCDICQLVCPKNECLNDVSDREIPIKTLINLSNKQFKQNYKNSAFGWRGNKIIKRNAIIALGNEQNRQNIELLKPLLKHQSYEIRLYSIWSIYKSDAKQASYILKKHREMETNKVVLREIGVLLEHLNEL